MVHEVGRGNEQEVTGTINAAFRAAEEICDLKPNTVIILVPPHGPAFGDAMSINTDEYLYGDMKRFNAPYVAFKFKNNRYLADLIMRRSAENGIITAPIDSTSPGRYGISNNLDHGSMVPLYFVNKRFQNFKLVHITYGLLSNEELYHFGRIIKDSVEETDENAVFIASGDLSHRLTHDAPDGYNPHGIEFDKKIVRYIEDVDVDAIMNMDRELVESAGQCGYRSIITACGTLDGAKAEGEIYSYEGPFGVGYCVAGFKTAGECSSRVERYYNQKKDELKSVREHEDPYVKLARMSLEYYIKEGRIMPLPDNLPDEMLKNNAGVFVSLKKDNQLRGCIGTIEGVQQNIAKEIIENAVSAGTRDPRFYPVEQDELDDIIYSVDVLGHSEPVGSKDQLDPLKYGVIVRKGTRSGLLLPNLEGVDTVEDQLGIALKKAGIGEDESYKIERFEVTRHR